MGRLGTWDLYVRSQVVVFACSTCSQSRWVISPSGPLKCRTSVRRYDYDDVGSADTSIIFLGTHFSHYNPRARVNSTRVTHGWISLFRCSRFPPLQGILRRRYFAPVTSPGFAPGAVPAFMRSLRSSRHIDSRFRSGRKCTRSQHA